MKFMKILSELRDSNHIGDRIAERYFFNELPVLLRYKTRQGYATEEVGVYVFTPKVKEKILKTIELIFSYSFQPNITLGILVHDFRLNSLTDVEFYDDALEEFTTEHLENNTGSLFLTDYEPENNRNTIADRADSLQLVIRNDKAITTYFGRKNELTPQDMRVDYVVTNIMELEKYAVSVGKPKIEIKKRVAEVNALYEWLKS